MSPSSIILDSGPPNYRPFCGFHINPPLRNLIIDGHYKYTFLQILNMFLLIIKGGHKFESFHLKYCSLYIWHVKKKL